MRDLVEKSEEAAVTHEKNKFEKKVAVENDKAAAEDQRNKAMESLSETKKRKGIPKCCYMLTYISHKIHKYHGMSHRILQIYALLEKRWFNFHSFPSIHPPPLLLSR